MKERNDKQEKISWKDKFRYGFDNIMSAGTISMVGILFTITAVVVIVAGILEVLLDGPGDGTVGSSIWVSLMHAIDPGTLTADRDRSFSYMLLMTLVTICGLFITSVLFGIVSTGMRNKMESLRKGKSKVLERDHTIILGFNRSTYILLRELLEANANQKEATVVIMDCCMEKEEMEAAIHQRFPAPGSTRIICRRGDVTDLADISVCSPERARSVIINSMDDFLTIKSILAVTTLLKKARKSRAYITAVIADRENCEAARIAGENRAEILSFDDTIARIVAQASRQPGLSEVYTELFSYEGDEIYLEEHPQLVGRRMKDLNLYFPRSTVLGLEKDGKILMNPQGDTLVERGDRLVLIAADDGVSVPLDHPMQPDREDIVESFANSPEPRRRMLILGYGPRLGKILQEQDAAMTGGSEIVVAVQEEYAAQARAMVLPSYGNISVTLRVENLYHKDRLSDLLDWEPDSVLVLNTLQEDAQADDSRTLVLLLKLRSVAREQHVNHPITSEMRSVENQELAQVTEVRDFVISSHITSLMIAHISQCRALREIFDGLLTDEGAELYMRPAGDYVKLGCPVDLYTASAAAAVKHQVFLGYRRKNEKTGQLEVWINQEKNTVVHFDNQDSFIVLADD